MRSRIETADTVISVEYHCQTNYETVTFPPGQTPTYQEYSSKWKPLEQDVFYSHVQKGLEAGTILIRMILDSQAKPIGYFHADLTSLPEWGIYKAEIRDIYVESDHQRRGIGTQVMAYLETECRKMGINLLRSGTGALNHKSIGLHRKTNWVVWRVEYEKWLG